MRRSALLSLLPLLAAAPIAAQQFEGTVLVKTAATGEAKYLVKGDKMVIVMQADPSLGALMAGKEMRMIIDRTSMVTTILIPIEMGPMKGIKTVIDMKKEAANLKPVEVKMLGTTQMLAGYRCEDMSITEGKNVTLMCMTTQLGTFVYPQGGMGRGGSGPGWVAALAAHPGFPLKVTGGDGKLHFEVTSVLPGRISSDEFIIPEGYQDMSHGIGPGGRGGQ